MNQPSARAEEPKQKPPQLAETTYFWHPEHDSEVCREYVRRKYPETKARVVFVLPTHRLLERAHVIGLVRKRPSPTEVYQFEQGRRVAVPVPIEKLLEEVVEGKPVAVRDFISGGNEYEDGALDAPALIDRLAKDYGPAVCHYRSDDGKAHLFGA